MKILYSMQQFSNITTLVFDFGDVIIDLDMSRCIQRFKDLGFDDIESYLGLYGQTAFFLEFEKGNLDKAQFRDAIREHTRPNVSDEEIDNAWCGFLCNIPQGKLELLGELKKKFRLLLLSNTNPIHIEQIAPKEFAKSGKTMQDYFERCYLSYQMKLTKPHAEIFEALLSDARVVPEECLFLDDGPKNIEQADKLGFQTYLVTPGEDLSFLLNSETWK